MYTVKYDKDLLKDLARAKEYMGSHWMMQNNRNDNASRLIYETATFDGLLDKLDRGHYSEEERNYVIHRWFNLQTSTICEELFIEHGATRATAEENKYGHTDIFVGEIPLDVKLTVYPRGRNPGNRRSKLERRTDRDELIRWMYANQSKGYRHSYNNRLFIVCMGDSVDERNGMKLDFHQIDSKIKILMEHWIRFPEDMNSILLDEDDAPKAPVYAEVIPVYPSSSRYFTGSNPCPRCGSTLKLALARNATYRDNIILRCPSCSYYTDV